MTSPPVPWSASSRLVDPAAAAYREGRTDESGELRFKHLAAGQVVDVNYRTTAAADLETLLRRGDITVGVVIPADFERRLADPQRAAAHLLVDGSDPSILSVARQLTETPPPGGAGRPIVARARSCSF